MGRSSSSRSRAPMPRRLLAPALLLCWLAAATPAVAAPTGPCFAGATGAPCQFQTGRVTEFNDGDTVSVDLDGDRSRRAFDVRFRAVQAMELRRYSRKPSLRRGECHAVEAANRAERLIRAAGRRVRLSTQRATRDARGRLLRWVAVRRGGRWVDVGSVLMREGHTLWMDNTTDTAWNARYNRLGQEAALAGRGLWRRTRCGAGPQQAVPLRVWAQWNPTGPESAAGEWVKVQNRSATETLSLGGWWVRDAMLRRFTFPAGTRVAPGATVTVRVGGAARAAGEFAWGLPAPIFENAGDGRDLGDGAYLFDPRGDLRAWMLYPCVVACSDPYEGALDVTASPRRPESVTVANRSGGPVDLYGYALETPGSLYAFADPTVLQPGQRLTVLTGGDPADDGPLVRHWGRDGHVLPDRGGWARVTTFTHIGLACDAWGGARCP